MDGNFYMVFIAALVPIIIGFIWYHPKTLGNAWMKSANVSAQQLEGGNMPLILGLTYLFSVILTFAINFLVHHEMPIIGTIIMDQEIGVGAESAFGVQVMEFVDVIKARYDTFGHGLVHGIFYSIMIVLPILSINAMFERRGAKYIFIHFGYWLLTLGLMGGLLGQFY